jgi:hypothetical protein
VDVVIKIEGEIIDLFKDENIEVTSAVSSLEDIDKNKGDFSKTFTVPATENNNKIFLNWYRADLENNFDSKVKVSGTIEIGGKDFKSGFFTLTSSKVKSNKPSSYTIAFVGKNFSLTKLFREDLLGDLDLSDMNHPYTANDLLDIIKFGETDFTYTLISNKRYTFDSDVANIDQTNIAFPATGAGRVIFSDLRPSIKVAKILQAIESKYSISFSTDLFQRSEIQNLYFFGWKSANDLQPETLQATFTTTTNINRFYNNSVNFTTFKTGGTGRKHYVRFDLTTISVEEYEVIFFDNGKEIQREKSTGSKNFAFFLESESPINRSVTVFVSCANTFAFSYIIRLFESVFIPISGWFAYLQIGSTATVSKTILGDFDISRNIIEIKVIDFLKGLLSMYKGVIIPTDEEIYIDTNIDYYSKGNLYDISKYIDRSEYNVNALKPFSEIAFKFAEPKTILNIEYKRTTGFGYGDLVLNTGLDGEPYTINLPFENILVENLTDQDTSLQNNLIVGGLLNEDSEPTNISAPFLHYVKAEICTTAFTYDIATIRTPIQQYQAVTYADPARTYSTLFGVENEPLTNLQIENSLYYKFYKNYIEGLFNTKTKIFNFSSYLPNRIILNLGLNDIFKIGAEYFRIDNYTTELTGGKSSLNLFPIFDELISSFIASRTEIITDYLAKTETVTVTNLNPYTSDLSETWVTLTSEGNNLLFIFDENDTGLVRTASTIITNTNTGQTVAIEITQNFNVTP